MRFADLVATSEEVAARGARLAKVQALTELLNSLPDSGLELKGIEAVVTMLAGELPFGKIGVGWKTAQKALPEAAAQQASLTLDEVLEAFQAIAATSGRGSQAKRLELLVELFERATKAEQSFLARLLIGELRQGALDGVMLEALAGTSGVALADLRRAAMLAGDTATVARALLVRGASALAEFRLQIFRPVRPMLAQPAEEVADALSRLGQKPVAVELKVDGARVQIHRKGSEVRIYSRALREVTEALPEVEASALALPAEELILDGEAYAVTPNGHVQPFQTTMRRFGRKQDASEVRARLPVEVLFFDGLMIDGEELIDQPARARFARLEALLPRELRMPRLLDAGEQAAADFLHQATADGHEGIMIKDLSSTYQAGARGTSWIKVKPVHTLDLVVLAAEWGSGRRRGKLSNLHLGARDTEREGFAMLGKTFKGLTDALLAWQTERLLVLETHREGHVVFVRPELVVEIAFNDVQRSPTYPSGLALRFARVKRYREDKRAADADTLARVREIHHAGLPTTAASASGQKTNA